MKQAHIDAAQELLLRGVPYDTLTMYKWIRDARELLTVVVESNAVKQIEVAYDKASNEHRLQTNQ